MIFVATLSSALETVDTLSEQYATVFNWCEIVVTAIFTLEYLGHLLTTRRKLSYVFSFWGLIDLVSIVPTFFQVANVTALKSARMLRVLRVLRVMRVLKLAREAVAKMETDVMEGVRRSPLKINLVIYCLAMFSVIIISSTLEFYAEYRHGEVATVQRVSPTLLRLGSDNLTDEAPSAKISISGGSPFDGTWDVKSWSAANHTFDVVVPDEEVMAQAGEARSIVKGTRDEPVKWAKDTPFTSVPQAMWWCITTLTTVGYGDMYPVTVCGRLVAAGTMLCGLVLFGMLMNIVGKAMMVALFGTDQLDETSPAPAGPGSNNALAWDPQWRHCPTCGHRATEDHHHREEASDSIVR